MGHTAVKRYAHIAVTGLQIVLILEELLGKFYDVSVEECIDGGILSHVAVC